MALGTDAFKSGRCKLRESKSLFKHFSLLILPELQPESLISQGGVSLLMGPCLVIVVQRIPKNRRKHVFLIKVQINTSINFINLSPFFTLQKGKCFHCVQALSWYHIVFKMQQEWEDDARRLLIMFLIMCLCSLPRRHNNYEQIGCGSNKNVAVSCFVK